MQDDEQKQENTTQATQAFFAAPEEFTVEKPAVKQESKPVLEKFVKPEQDMAPAGSFLNPYRQKAIDFRMKKYLLKRYLQNLKPKMILL